LTHAIDRDSTLVLPPGAGFRLNSDDHLVVQVLYASATTPGIEDESGFRLTLASSPAMIDAAVFRTGYIWANALQPPMDSRASTCQLDSDLTVFAFEPWMNGQGTSFVLEHQPAGQSFSAIFSWPAFTLADRVVHAAHPPITM